jgi:hypothetical protein
MMSHSPAKGGLFTLCWKELRRCNWTEVKSSVTCRHCRKALSEGMGV